MSFLSNLNPVNAIKNTLKVAAHVLPKAVEEVKETADAVINKTADVLNSDVRADDIWNAAADAAGKAGQVIHTTSEKIANRLIPRALVEKLPGFRADVDSNAQAGKKFGSEDEARAAQARASEQLLDVNKWGETLATTPPQRFELYDESGKKVDRPAQEGDYVQITPLVPGTQEPIPGVAPNWVRVESASATEDKTEVVVRPSKDPTGANPAPTAHVFDSRATNTFSVERQGSEVKSSVRGRDEHANDGAEAGGAKNATLNRLGAEALWGAPKRHIGVGDRVITASPQQQLWDTFTTNLVQA